MVRRNRRPFYECRSQSQERRSRRTQRGAVFSRRSGENLELEGYSWWANWWLFKLVFTGVIGVITTVWFLIGGFKDLSAMFGRLKTIQRNADDDGTVEVDEHFGSRD